jgi:hypothetical protein
MNIVDRLIDLDIFNLVDGNIELVERLIRLVGVSSHVAHGADYISLNQLWQSLFCPSMRACQAVKVSYKDRTSIDHRRSLANVVSANGRLRVSALNSSTEVSDP